MNPEDIIDKNIAGLVEHIEVKNSALWERLIEIGLFKFNDVKYIQVSVMSLTCD